MSNFILDARAATDHFPGIGRYVVHLAQALAQIAPEYNISLLHDPTVLATRLALPDLPRVSCPVSPFSIRQQWIVPRQLQRLGASLYHSPYYLMPYWPAVPTVLTCHDLIPLIYPQYFRAAQRLVYRMAHILALKAAHVVIAVSEATKADLIHYFRIPPEQVVVILEAANPHFHPQSASKIAAMRQEYALPERYALYLGSNKPHKNLVRLVEAWAQIQVENIQLVVAGHWDSRYPQARRRAEQLNVTERICFLGSVAEKDLPALYSGAELFVFPSLYEGFGLPVLEAMACGTPVVCSNTSSLPELAEEAAILIDPLDIEALAQTLQRTLQDTELRQELREMGLARANKFSWEQTAQKTLAAYQRAFR